MSTQTAPAVGGPLGGGPTEPGWQMEISSTAAHPTTLRAAASSSMNARILVALVAVLGHCTPNRDRGGREAAMRR